MTVVIFTYGSNRKVSALAFEVDGLVEAPKRRLRWIIKVAGSFRATTQGQACMLEMLMNLKMYLDWLGPLMNLRRAICDLQINWAPHPLILLKRHSGRGGGRETVIQQASFLSPGRALCTAHIGTFSLSYRWGALEQGTPPQLQRAISLNCIAESGKTSERRAYSTVFVARLQLATGIRLACQLLIVARQMLLMLHHVLSPCIEL